MNLVKLRPLEGRLNRITQFNYVYMKFLFLFCIDNFYINPQTGVVESNHVLDRENISSYNLTVTANDGGQPPLLSSVEVGITVLDMNDNKPMFEKVEYEARVEENAAVGTVLLKVFG